MKDQNPWERAYTQKTFDMITPEPGGLVKKYEHLLQAGDRILDAGSGRGRNSIYLASKGFQVDSFDVADLGWVDELPVNIKSKINFTKQDANDFEHAPGTYKMIIASRLLQYLSDEQLDGFLKKAHASLQTDGFITISYTASGGIFTQTQIEVPKYYHSVEDVRKQLESLFSKVVVEKGMSKTQGVTHEADVETFDIFASN